MRNLLSSALKDNVYLEKAVLTGILKISKESIFSGLNNILICSMLNENAADKFGFTETEVKQLLEHYDFSEQFEDIKRMYDGYNFSDVEIYNPWSILYFVENKKLDIYWVNTSANSLIKTLCQKADESIKRDMEILVEKGKINKYIDDNIVFPDLGNDLETLWSFLLMNGYLRYDNLSKDSRFRTVADLSVPNEEIFYVYMNDIVPNWFVAHEKTKLLENLINQLVSGDLNVFKSQFISFCQDTFSYFDVKGQEPEKFYHGFVLGLVTSLRNDYIIKSNREAGYGRFDVMIKPKIVASDKWQVASSPPVIANGACGVWQSKGGSRGIIIEFKTIDKKKKETFEKAIEIAKKQMIEKNYTQELSAHHVKEIVQIIVIFAGKEVRLIWSVESGVWN
jgi:hypothetical protein